MRVLVVPSWYKSKENPLSGSFFFEQAAALAKRGISVDLVYWYSDALGASYVEKNEIDGVHEYLIHFKPLKIRLNWVIIIIQILKIIHNNKSKPNVIHVHSYGATRYARLISRFLKVPYIVTEHTTQFERELLSKRDIAYAKSGFKEARRVIAVSEGLKDCISKYCDKEIIVIPNMVNDSFFDSGINNEKNNDNFKFISVGYLTHKKGMDTLLMAFEKVLKYKNNVELTFCGGGEEQAALERLANELGVAEHVKFYGDVSRERVGAEMYKNDAFVLASRIETFGIVFIEAMACGLPIIMTKTNAYKTIINGESGLAVEIDDVDGLSTAMTRMVDEYERYSPDVIRNRCYEMFSEEKVCEQIVNIYDEVIRSI